jgi:Mg2+-importing ATPase
MARLDHERGWKRGRASEALERLRSSPSGLDPQDAAARLAELGANALRLEPQWALARLILRQVSNPLLLVLAAAAVVSGLLGDMIDSTLVIVMLALSVLLGLLQEYRASRALEKLRERLTLRCTVRRDGARVDCAVAEIVPGDVVELRAGSIVPGDGRLIEARNLFVNESLLTGESLPVQKRVDAPGWRDGCAFQGTSIASGTGALLIAETSADTEFGRIASRLRLGPEQTDFEQGLRRFGVLLMQLILVLVVLVFAASAMLARPPIEALLFAIALAIGMSPEMLPTILSVTLARGARDMLAQGVLVRRLGAIENLGSIQVLCADKTGTLTEGVLTLAGCIDAQGADSARVRDCAFINASLQTGLQNPLDEALRRSMGGDLSALAGRCKLDEIPYDFERRRLTVVATRPLPATDRGSAQEAEMITKGSIDSVLAACTSVRDGDLSRPLDAEARAALLSFCEQHLARGFRALAVATRTVELRAGFGIEDERSLCFEGLLLFDDPPRTGISAVIEELLQLGVDIKIVSGDHPLAVLHAARAVGMRDPTVCTGDEIEGLDDAELRDRVRDTTIFARINPQQKERIVHALRDNGLSVGFLGDGINDAPALRAADVGISVESAVDVARESADFVLLSADLEVLRRGVVLGRTAFANTLKYILSTTSANFGNMISLAAASFLLPFLPMLPTQILLNNLLSDLPSLAIAGDRVDPEWIRQPHAWNIAQVRNFMILFGVLSSVFDLLTFGILYGLFAAQPDLFRTGWFVESLLTEVAVLLVIRTRLPVWQSRPGYVLAVTSALVATAAIVLPWTPLGQWFGLVPMPTTLLAAVLGITLAYVLASELTKQRFFLWLATNR